jgi:hypothetical protein
MHADSYIDVRDYGAACDWNGSTGTDDTAAIQAAIDAAESGNIRRVLISGRCKITAPIEIQAINLGIELFGRGPSVSELYQATAAENAINVMDPPVLIVASRKKVKLSRFRISGVGAGTSTGIGLRVYDLTGGAGTYNGGFFTAEDLEIIGFSVGVDFRSWDNSRFVGVEMNTNATGLIIEDCTKTVTFLNCNVVNSTVQQIDIISTNGQGSVLFIGCDIGGAASGSQIDVKTAGDTTFMSCNFERVGTGSNAAIEQTAGRLSVYDCTFLGDTSTKPAVLWASTANIHNCVVSGFGTGGGKMRRTSASATGGITGNAGLSSNRQTVNMVQDNAGQYDLGPWGCVDHVRHDSMSTAVAANRGLLQYGAGTGTAADRIELKMFDGSAQQRAVLGLIETKTTTGDPTTGHEGRIVINTFDNTVKIYADAAWRTIASGW